RRRPGRPLAVSPVVAVRVRPSDCGPVRPMIRLAQNHAAPVRVAVLGGGAVTRELHLPALRRTAAAAAAAVVDPDPEAAAYLRAIGYDGEVVAAGWEDFLADPKALARLGLDAVVVALPNVLHEAAALRSLECGLNVLCEKPLALSAA